MNEEIKEEWRDVVGYEGLYQVSNTGKVRNTTKNFELKQSNIHGYKNVHLSKNIEWKMFRVHRLVAEAFIPNPENKPCIDHIDGIKDNNIVTNLRWVTVKENTLNPATFIKQIEKLRKTHCTKEFSEKISKIRSTPEFWEKYRESYKKVWENNGKREHYPNERPVRNIETGLIWKSTRDLARFLKINQSNAYRYCKGLRNCNKIVTFENGVTVYKPHFEFINKEKEDTNV